MVVKLWTPGVSTVLVVGLKAPSEPVLGKLDARKGSSTVPLQLSSSELQSSVVGTTWPGQVEPHEPAMHVCVPGRQTPTPEVPEAPV